MKNSVKYAILVLLAGFLWGLIAIFIRVLNQAGIDSLACVAVRNTFAAVLMLLYILITDPKQLKIRLRDLPWFLGTGILSIAFFNYCYFEAIHVIGGAAVPALLLYTAPVFVMLLSAPLYHEKITRKKVIAVIGTLIGLGLVTGAFGGGETLSAKAILLGIGSGFGYALYSIFGKGLTKRYGSVTITFYTFAVAAVVMIPASGVLSQLEQLCSVRILADATALALFSTVLPFLLYTTGLRKIEAGRASILATMEPFTAAIVGVILFQEHFTAARIIGMALVLASIIFLNVGKSGSVQENAESADTAES